MTITTPPPTVLDTPSPTEQNFSSSDTMTQKPAKAIYLIVATSVSPRLGIGFKGSLPWPQIKSDMAFFRKVTSGTSPASTAEASGASRNAVIMGRKTWESIPMKFRPLGGRVNVVLTRQDQLGLSTMAEEMRDQLRWNEGKVEAQRIGTEGDCVSITKQAGNAPEVVITNSLHIATSLESHGVDINNLYCIGGAEIYKMFMADEQLRSRVRLLQTQVRKTDGGEFECDTFFPENIDGSGGRWTQADETEIKEWTDVELPQGKLEWARDEKAEVEIRVVGWTTAES